MTDDLDDGDDNRLGDIVAAIERLRTSVERRPKTAHSVTALACGLFVYLLISSWAGAIWNSKPVMSARYGVPTAQITIDEEPHDCDFLRAPLGVKGCSYVREVTAIKTGTNAAGEHFASYDNGKTWSPDPAQQAKIGVTVWWRKE
jgi:hypothetical protein